MAGPIAGTMDNIGAFMAIGTFAGLLNALFYWKVYDKMNKNSVFDTYGVMYIFVASIFGTMMVQPLVLIGMIRNSIASNLLNDVTITN